MFARKLRVEVPYHSVRMDPLRDELLAALADIAPIRPSTPLWSTVTGRAVKEALQGPEYWWSNVRESVRFADTAAALMTAGYRQFLEVGPHPVLASSIQECAQARGLRVKTIATLVREKPEAQVLAETLARLWEAGQPLDWQAQLPSASRYVPVPTYPWQRQRFWEESEATRRQRFGYQGHPLLGHPVVGPKPIREVELNRQYFPWLEDHRVDGTPVFPGVGYAEIGLALSGPSSTSRSASRISNSCGRWWSAPANRLRRRSTSTSAPATSRCTAPLKGVKTAGRWQLAAPSAARPPDRGPGRRPGHRAAAVFAALGGRCPVRPPG